MKHGRETSRQKIVDFFSEHHYFFNLTPKEKAYLANLCSIKKYKKDQVVFQEGDIGDALHIVKKGNVKIFKTGFLGDEAIAMMPEGEIYGEMSLIDSYPRSANAKAAVDTEVLIIKKEKFELLKKENPRLAIKLMALLLKLLSLRLRSTTLKALLRL